MKSPFAKFTFEVWMHAVDSELRSRLQVTSEDVPDMPYKAWFEKGVSPRSAVTKIEELVAV